MDRSSFGPTPPNFHDAAHSLATAAESISKAALAMVEAAQEIARFAQIFNAPNTGLATYDDPNRQLDDINSRSANRSHVDDANGSGSGEKGNSVPADNTIASNWDESDSATKTANPRLDALRANATKFGTTKSKDPSYSTSSLYLSVPWSPESNTTDPPIPNMASYSPHAGEDAPNASKALSGVSSSGQAKVSKEPKRPRKTPSVPKPSSTEGSLKEYNMMVGEGYFKTSSFIKRGPTATENHWDKYYIHLEENFDAIPIISCMAVVGHKTICFVPGRGVVDAYKKIFSEITRLDVFTSELKPFLSTPASALLLVEFADAVDSDLWDVSVDCFIHWGWPPRHYLKRFKEMKNQSQKFLLIPAGQHLKPKVDSSPSNYHVQRYLDGDVNKYFKPESLIHEVRDETIRVLTEIDIETVNTLYRGWLNYYGSGPTRREDWILSDLIKYGQEYAATVLLRGQPSDGSKVYPPVSTQRLLLPEWIIEKSQTEVQPELVEHRLLPTSSRRNRDVRSTVEIRPLSTWYSHADNRSMSPSSPRQMKQDIASSNIHIGNSRASVRQIGDSPWPLGHFFVILEEDFDAIPLITYLANMSQKTTCFVPSPVELGLHREMFQALCDLDVINPAGKHETPQYRARLASAQAPTMLILPYRQLRVVDLQALPFDTLICWGAPTNMSAYVNELSQSSRSYLILSRDDYDYLHVENDLSKMGIVEHPNSQLINDLGPRALIGSLRQKALSYISRPEFSDTAERLYHALLQFYDVGRRRPKDITPFQAVKKANIYAARCLLRGTSKDGSGRYPPVEGPPRLRIKLVKMLNLAQDLPTGLISTRP
ncbi:hypothetical protein RhiJN_18432 [Ceratobasidium sp. AG-Ba]|nr:hypothetical protein RhiJN_18432 [Ceratobasidium sp. AG-Ba]